MSVAGDEEENTAINLILCTGNILIFFSSSRIGHMLWRAEPDEQILPNLTLHWQNITIAANISRFTLSELHKLP